MVRGGGGLGGVVVCPERKVANKRNAAARKINGDSPRGIRITGYRMKIQSRERFALRWCADAGLRIGIDNGGASYGPIASDTAILPNTSIICGRERHKKEII